MVTKLLALLSALGLVAAAPTGEPLTIDAIVPLTGAASFAGQIHANALRVYETVVNATGGVRGRSVHFDIHDDQSNLVLTVQLTNQLLAKHVPVIMGSTYIAACAAEQPLVAKGPVEFCLSPGLVTTQHNVFSSSVANTFIVPTQFTFFRGRGYTRVAVVSTTDASGYVAERMSNEALARPENKVLTLVANEHFNPTDISVSAQVARIKAGNAQAIVVNGVSGTAFGNLLRALNDAGVDLPIICSAANMNPVQLEQYKAFLPKELIFNTTLAFARDEVRDRGLRASIDEMYDAYRRAGVELTPESSFSWDPAKIVVAAFRKIGPNATGDQIADYINALHGFPGASGIYDFRTGDHHGLTTTSLVFVKWMPTDKSFAVVSKPGGAPL
jgi:branched-chain amino acid transport system substrate-binding protein